MRNAAICLKDVTKSFGALCAVNGMSLDVAEGSIFGLLGPNGAGKSTTMSLCAGLLRPDKGQITLGCDATGATAPQRTQGIALMPQGNALDPMLSIRDNLVYYCKLLRLPRRQTAAAIERVVEIFGISKILSKSVFAISGGQYRRAQLARTFLGNPRLMLLDEPTLGIDIQGKLDIWHNIRLLTKTSRTTVLLASNDLAEVKELCDEVAFINQGRLLYRGSAVDIPSDGRKVIECTINSPYSEGKVRTPSGVRVEVLGERLLKLTFGDYDDDTLTLVREIAAVFGLEKLSEERAPLVDLFNKYGGVSQCSR